jgi:hypothetical protein
MVGWPKAPAAYSVALNLSMDEDAFTQVEEHLANDLCQAFFDVFGHPLSCPRHVVCIYSLCISISLNGQNSLDKHMRDLEKQE